MPMKAEIVAGRGANTCTPELPPPSEEALPLGPDDALIMVLFPKGAWDEVRRLADDLHVAPQEALGAALTLLRARVDKELGR